MCVLQRVILEPDFVNHRLDQRYLFLSIIFFLFLWIILADFDCVLLMFSQNIIHQFFVAESGAFLVLKEVFLTF